MTTRWLLRLAAVVPLASGCVGASLASSTGPRIAGRIWSTQSKQLAHVGETVQFDFVLVDWRGGFVSPFGLAEYVVAFAGTERIEAEFNEKGHISFSYPFDSMNAGDVIKVKVTAFSQRGSRDWMRIGDEWLQNDSPYDSADRRVARDSITLKVYEAPIELAVERPPDGFDLQTAVLKIARADGAIRSVYVERPTRPGFTAVESPNDDHLRIRYLPSGADLNPTGTTEVEFTVYDMAGRLYRVTQTLTTP